MAVTVDYPQPLRKAQAATLARIFGLPDDSCILLEWSMDQAGKGARLDIRLATFITLEQVNELLNPVASE